MSLKIIVPLCGNCKYIDLCHSTPTEKICNNVLKSIGVPTKNDWEMGVVVKEFNPDGLDIIDFILIGDDVDLDKIQSVIALYKIRYPELKLKLTSEQIYALDDERVYLKALPSWNRQNES